jgi:hypothetical protein
VSTPEALWRWAAPAAPPARLAALRISAGGFALVYLIVRTGYLTSYAELPSQTFHPVGVASWLEQPLPPAAVYVLHALALATGGLYLLGARFRLSGPVFAALLLWVLTYRNSWSMIFHTENLLVLHVIVIGLSRAADAWAFDAKRDAPPSARYGWAIRTLSALTVLSYVLAGVAKLRNTGWEWALGDALRVQVAYDTVRKIELGSFHSPLGAYLVRHAWVFPPLALATMALELGAPLALLRERWGRIWAFGAWGFHWGVFALMAITFPYALSGFQFFSFFRVETWSPLQATARAVKWLARRAPRLGATTLLTFALLAVTSHTRADEKARAGPSMETMTDADAHDAAPPPSRAASPSPSRRAVAIAGAIVPGLVVHGTGHYVLGRTGTGSRLLALEGIGAGMFLAGGVPIVLTGANRFVVGPAAALVIAGFGVWSMTWLADVYGVSWPEHARGRAPRHLPRLQTELGYLYVDHPQFSFHHLFEQALDFRHGRLRLRPSAVFASDDANVRFRVLGSWRWLGTGAARATTGDGSFTDVDVALTHHRYDSDGFSIATAEAMLNGRLDLGRLAVDLTGSFGEFGLGLGLQAFDYDVPALGFATDIEQLFLARFGFGAYLGAPDEQGGEVSIYYDHRHDGYAAGLRLGGLGSGVAGHFGLSANWYFDAAWGVALRAEVGSAYLTGFSLLFRQGTAR